MCGHLHGKTKNRDKPYNPCLFFYNLSQPFSPFIMLKRILRILRVFVSLFLVTSVGSVVLYRFIPVSYTPLMFIRCMQQWRNYKPIKLEHQWVGHEYISPHLPMAVIASEDNLFADHNGFDFDQIKKAIEAHKKGKPLRGASTISQQTAKNVFLWPSSDWIRKGLEVYFTILIELIWGKERIMEVYLNSIEMAPGIYGVEAVAKAHFGTDAKSLNRTQCALIAASLPNPLRFDSANPSKYMNKRKQQILNLMRLVKPFSFSKRE